MDYDNIIACAANAILVEVSLNQKLGVDKKYLWVPLSSA